MDNVLVTAITGVVSTGIGAVIGAWVNRAAALKTARSMLVIDRQKYAQDRLWDARKESYSAIIAKVRDTTRLAETIYAAFVDPYGHPEEYFQSQAYSRNTQELWEAWRGAEAEYDRARLLVSDAFVAEFERLQANLAAIDHDDIPPDRAEQTFKVFDDALDPMLATAKREIAPEIA